MRQYQDEAGQSPGCDISHQGIGDNPEPLLLRREDSAVEQEYGEFDEEVREDIAHGIEESNVQYFVRSGRIDRN